MIEALIEWFERHAKEDGWVLSSVTYDYDANPRVIETIGGGVQIFSGTVEKEVRATFLRPGFHEHVIKMPTAYTDGQLGLYRTVDAEVKVVTEAPDFPTTGYRDVSVQTNPTTYCRTRGAIVRG